MDDHRAIQRLIALYAQLLDSGRLQDWGGLFAEEAEFRVSGSTFLGRSEIVREIGGMQPDTPVKHVALPPVIDLLDAAHARSWSDLCALSTAGGTIQPATIGRYHDELVKDPEDGRWRFARRVLVMGGEAVPDDVEPTPAW